MPELTDADRAAIDRVRDEWRESWSGEPAGESLAILDEMLARHFLAAGVERAAKVCEEQRDQIAARLYGDEYGSGWRAAAWGCAAAIRALLK